jgi:hypothetical protein
VILLGVLSIGVAAVALRPATVEIVGSGRLTTARCGADSYLFAYPDPVVHHACRTAYAPHAHVLLGALAVALVALVALGNLLGRDGRRLLLLATAAAVALAIVLLAVLRPLDIAVPENGTSVVASCGFDSYVAGYPDHAVQSACRSHVATHAADALGAAALAAVGLGGLALASEDRRKRIASRHAR